MDSKKEFYHCILHNLSKLFSSGARGENLNVLESSWDIDSESKRFQSGRGTWYTSISVYSSSSLKLDKKSSSYYFLVGLRASEPCFCVPNVITFVVSLCCIGDTCMASCPSYDWFSCGGPVTFTCGIYAGVTH